MKGQKKKLKINAALKFSRRHGVLLVLSFSQVKFLKSDVREAFLEDFFFLSRDLNPGEEVL